MEQTTTINRHMGDECEAHRDLSSMEIIFLGSCCDIDNFFSGRWM